VWPSPNIYFPQAISPLIACDLHVPGESAALVATAVQLGYAAGLFLLVPLVDRLPHRPLIITGDPSLIRKTRDRMSG
jgi:predicted MFS family arabinose efflux permease